MIALARHFIQKLFRPRSTQGAMKRILSRKQYAVLTLSAPDRREYFETASKISGLAVEELLSRAGRVLDLPALLKVKAHEKVRTLFPSPSLLYVSGAIPLIRNNVVVGLVCVDPEISRKHLREFSALPLFLSSWSIIKSALDAVPWNEQNPDKLDDVPESVYELAQSIMEHLFHELKRFGESNAVITLFPNPQFAIPLSDGRTAKGNIRNGVQQLLKNQFAQKSSYRVQGETIIAQPIPDMSGFFISIASPASVIQFPDSTPAAPALGKEIQEGHILFVDDNATFAKVLEKFFSNRGLKVMHATNGAHALEVLSQQGKTPQLIICDIHMPVMNGFEFVRKLKEDPRFLSIPVIMLTSDCDVEAEIALLHCGVEAFIGKQEDPRILCTHAQRILDRAKYREAA